jgi:hypothetical protein
MKPDSIDSIVLLNFECDQYLNRLIMNARSLPSPILLYAYFPGRCIVQVHVNPQSQISDLHHYFPSENVTFVANGIRLADSDTFQSCAIRDKDVIIAIPASAPANIPRWCALSEDSEAFAEQVGFLVNQRTSREVARLRDFQMTRVDRRPRQFRRYVSNFQTAHQPFSSRPGPGLSIGESASAPSVAPLPTLWREPGEDSDMPAAAEMQIVKEEHLVPHSDLKLYQ